VKNIVTHLDHFSEAFFELHGKPFSLQDRNYLRPIYRAVAAPDVSKVLLKFARQTEKCVHPGSWVSTDIGYPIRICRLENSGASVLSWDPDSESHKVSRRYQLHKNDVGRVYNLKTESGNELHCAASHLLLCKESEDAEPMWLPAILAEDMYVAEPIKAWRFLEHDHEPYDIPNPYIFGLNESRSWDTAELIGLESIDLPNEKEAVYYQAFLSKLGFFTKRDGNHIEVQKHVDEETIRWSRILEVKKGGYSEWFDIEILDGPPAYTANNMVVHNTTTMAAIILGMSALIPHLATLCVNPTDLNMQYFSREKLDPFLQSKIYRRMFGANMSEQATMTKTLKNGSRIFLRAAYRHADRSRGISADLLMIDEIQDVRQENIQIIGETLSHSKIAKRIYAGTPKTYDNPLEREWLRSKQWEYAIDCKSCKKRNIIDEYNIDDRGLICSKPTCRRLIDPKGGKWISLNPHGESEAFRFPAVSAPWVSWDDIIEKRDTYSRQAFLNEVLAISCDEGLTPISAEQVIRSCDSGFTSMWEECPPDKNRQDFFMGVDWGTRENGSTVVTVMMKDRKRYRVVNAKAYKGLDADPDFIIEDIVRLFGSFNVKLLGVDWGGQMGENDRLRNKLGYNKVVEFFYCNTRPIIKYEKQSGRMNLDRERSLALMFNEMKDGGFVFPSWETDFKKIGTHLLNVVTEYSPHRRINQHVHKPGERDDFMHSLNYARVASRIQYLEWIAA
jgi:hypothetical protein